MLVLEIFERARPMQLIVWLKKRVNAAQVRH